jgi:hypothetical protein
MNKLDQSNPFMQRLDQMHDAQVKWAYSEWLLNFLRSEGGLKPQIPTDEQLLTWAKSLH